MEFKKYNTSVNVNGTKVDVTVTVTVDEDSLGAEILLDADFETDAAREAYVAKVASGDVFAGTIHVDASALGLSGVDSLSGCELIGNHAWNSKPFEASVDSYLKDYGMEVNAINELIQLLENEYNLLSKRAKTYKIFSK